MGEFEAAAFARMLDRALARHLRSSMGKVPVRLPAVNSYARLAAVLQEWEAASAGVVLLRDHGPAVRAASVSQLHQVEPWPPRGVLAAADGTWVLESDGRVTRLY